MVELLELLSVAGGTILLAVLAVDAALGLLIHSFGQLIDNEREIDHSFQDTFHTLTWSECVPGDSPIVKL